MSTFGVLNGVVLNGTASSSFIACEPASAKAEATAQEPTRIRLAYGAAAVKADLPSGESYVTRGMAPKTVQGRALSFNNAGDTTILEVVLQYFTGTAISRAQSRGVHSVFFAESSGEANAETSISDDATYRSRRATGQPTRAKATAAGKIKQEFAFEGVAQAKAEASISPSIYYGGGSAKTAFGWGSALAKADKRPVTAVRNPFMAGAAQDALAASSAVPVPKFDMSGSTRANAVASGVDLRIRIERLIWLDLDVTSGEAVINTSRVKRINPFSGVSSASSEISATVAKRITNNAGVARSNAQSYSQPDRLAMMGGLAQVTGAALVDATINRARRFDGNSTAAAASQANNVTRFANLESTDQAQAESNASSRNAAIPISPGLISALAISSIEGRNAKVPVSPDTISALSEAYIEARNIIRSVSQEETKAFAQSTGVAINAAVPVYAESISTFSEAYGSGRNAKQAADPSLINARSEAYGSCRNATVATDADNAEGVGYVSLGWVETRNKQGLRILRRVDVFSDQAIGYVSTGRNVFKINAGEPAPDRRTIELPKISRNFTIPYASREYRV